MVRYLVTCNLLKIIMKHFHGHENNYSFSSWQWRKWRCGDIAVALTQLIWIKLMVWNVTYCTKSITSSWPSVKKDFQIEVYFEMVLLIVCTCVLRWNVVGIQGSLMSYFTEPIYFSSIILGSLYHADHLSRAMYQRIADIEDLPQQFTLNRPLLSGQCLLLSGVE